MPDRSEHRVLSEEPDHWFRPLARLPCSVVMLISVTVITAKFGLTTSAPLAEVADIFAALASATSWDKDPTRGL